MTNKQIIQRFNEIYETLYNSDTVPANYNLMIDMFDHMMEFNNQFKSAMIEVEKERQDVFMSDRECAAIMYTLTELKIA